MASVQRLMLYITPIWLLEFMCHWFPRTVIGLLCHWMNEKNPNREERHLAERFLNPVQVAKKMSHLSTVAILHLLAQDESLWKMYLPGVGRKKDNSIGHGKVIPMKSVPYILLELIFDLGGPAGKEKVKDIVARCRVTLGGQKQGEIFENLKTDMVLDLFEMLPPVEVKMRLAFCKEEAVALWLRQWDHRMKHIGRPLVSTYWVAQLTGERAFKIEKLMKDLEFRVRI